MVGWPARGRIPGLAVPSAEEPQDAVEDRPLRRRNEPNGEPVTVRGHPRRDGERAPGDGPFPRRRVLEHDPLAGEVHQATDGREDRGRPGGDGVECLDPDLLAVVVTAEELADVGDQLGGGVQPELGPEAFDELVATHALGAGGRTGGDLLVLHGVSFLRCGLQHLKVEGQSFSDFTTLKHFCQYYP